MFARLLRSEMGWELASPWGRLGGIPPMPIPKERTMADAEECEALTWPAADPRCGRQRHITKLDKGAASEEVSSCGFGVQCWRPPNGERY